MSFDPVSFLPAAWLMGGQFVLYGVGWVLLALLLSHDRSAAWHWAGFMGLVGAGYLLSAYRDGLRQWWPYAGSAISFVAGYVVLNRGLSRFCGLPPRDGRLALWLAACTVPLAWVGASPDGASWRVLIGFAASSLLVGRAIVVHRHAVRAEFGTALAWAVAAPAAGLALVFGGRALQQLSDLEHVTELQASSLADPRLVLVYLAGAAYFNFCLSALHVARLVRQLRAQSLQDALTGLPNRRALNAALETTAERRRRVASAGFAALALDIDHFKRINDGHGHVAGDRILEQFAQRVRDALRSGEFVARTGGEEFVVLLDTADAGAALAVAERLRRATAAAPFSPTPTGADLAVTVSIGVATATPADGDLRRVLGRADEALYRAKAGGRDRVVLADDAGPPGADVSAAAGRPADAGGDAPAPAARAQDVPALADGTR